MNRRSIYIGLATIILLMLVVVGAWAAWYSYERQVRIVQVANCNTRPVTMTAPDGSLVPVYSLDPCMVTVIPPSLGDLARGRMIFGGVPDRMKVNQYSLEDILLGHYTLGPNLALPCDQPATTTDCAALAARSPSDPAPTAIATSTETIGGFSFVKSSNWYVTGFGWEQVAVPGAYNISVPSDSGESHVYIFTKRSSLGSINPSAKTLDDYRSDYPISASSTRQILVKGKPTTIDVDPQVRILSSADVTINGIPMLKQRYSVGFWSLDADGNKIFDTSDEASVKDELRYVFFDGTTFVVITGWQSDPFIEQVARSVHVSPK